MPAQIKDRNRTQQILGSASSWGDALLALESPTAGLTPTYEGGYQDYYYPRSRWKELRWLLRDWYDQLDVDPIRLMRRFLFPTHP